MTEREQMRMHRINESCNIAAADTLRRAVEEADKMHLGAEERAAAILGYMVSHAVQFAAIAIDIRVEEKR